MSDSKIVSWNGGMTFAGEDAVRCYQATALGHALKLYGEHGLILSRGATVTRMLKLAASITGKTYKRSSSEALKASEDVLQWAREMAAALPKEHEE